MLVPSVGMSARGKQRYLRTCVDNVQTAAIREGWKVTGVEVTRGKRETVLSLKNLFCIFLSASS